MKRFLIVIDSFKGSLSAIQAACAVQRGILSAIPQAQVDLCPAADGGENSSKLAGEAVGAQRITRRVTGPNAAPANSFFYLKGVTAYVEIAAASGFMLIPKKSADTARRATSFGTGELISEAAARGAREIYLFLGGSATTDGGIGMAKALGVKFFDRCGVLLQGPPWFAKRGLRYPGERLCEVASFDIPAHLKEFKITAPVDVSNPLYGPNGAAFIYGPQKGADKDTVKELDGALRHLASVSSSVLGEDYSQQPGSGAAGGCGFAVLAFLGGKLVSGAELFLDIIDFEKRLESADCVVTGEGKVDSQSLHGKLLSAILRRVARRACPVVSLCGKNALGEGPSEYSQLRIFEMGERGLLDAEGELERLASRVFSKEAFADLSPRT